MALGKVDEPFIAELKLTVHDAVIAKRDKICLTERRVGLHTDLCAVIQCHERAHHMTHTHNSILIYSLLHRRTLRHLEGTNIVFAKTSCMLALQMIELK